MIALGLEALATVDLIIPMGADVAFPFRWTTKGQDDVATPVDLTGWTARAQVRDTFGGEVWLDLSSEDGEIELDAEGNVLVVLAHALTEGPSWAERSRILGGELRPSAVWDLELTNPSGEITRFARGAVSISPDVTRSAP